MNIEEVRKILKEYYTELVFYGDNGFTYGYKELGEYNHAYRLSEVYAWGVKRSNGY